MWANLRVEATGFRSLQNLAPPPHTQGQKFGQTGGYAPGKETNVPWENNQTTQFTSSYEASAEPTFDAAEIRMLESSHALARLY